jgi:Deoxyribonuclease II
MKYHRIALIAVILAVAQIARGQAPVPLLLSGHPVDWWFVFKFNVATFPGCDGDGSNTCPFGGSLQPYKGGQQFVYASSENSKLQKGTGCAGTGVKDPLGATVGQIYDGSYHYVVWNDQFYDDPEISGCTKNCSSPWGHSKGMLAWDDDGNGIVLQVTTPSWPAAGNKDHPRTTDGNTLGCVKDNNIKVSQHFFALRLTESDVKTVLEALQTASVVTDTTDSQIVFNGGPDEIKQLVAGLGRKSKTQTWRVATLSTGVQVIAKPSALHVPPWQMVSSLLGGVSLRTATWWAPPRIPSTTVNSQITCWDKGLQDAGAVQVATSGKWEDTPFGLKGGPGPDFNHAKIGVSVGQDGYTIFGDLNQQGTLAGDNCGSSQNGRGGLFFVVKDPDLSSSVAGLIKGGTAPKETLQ